MSATIEIQVEGMGCQKCVTAIEGAVKRLAPAAEVEVRLPDALVRISGADAQRAELEAVIEEAGYDVVRP